LFLERNAINCNVFLFCLFCFKNRESINLCNENSSEKNHDLIDLNRNDAYNCAADLAAGPILQRKQMKEQNENHDRSREFERSYDFSGDD